MVDSLNDNPLPDVNMTSDKSLGVSRVQFIEPTSPLINICNFQIDDNGVLHWDNLSAASHLLRCPPDYVPKSRTDWLEVIHPDDRSNYNNKIRSLDWDGAKISVKFRIKTSEGRWVWIEQTLQRVDSEAGKEKQIYSSLLDITRFQEDLERAVWASRHDVLTGLPNAIVFKEQLETLSALAYRLDCQGTVFRLRLTNLEHIQSLYGFDIGERVFRQISDRLGKIIKAPDCMAKITDDNGFDDFLLGIIGLSGPDKDPDILGGRLKQVLCGTPYTTPQGPIKIDMSIGYTHFPQPRRDVKTLLSQTERAVTFDSAKDINGYSPFMGLPKNTSNASLTATDIRAALDEKRISLAYQPIIHANDGALHHYECLLRLKENEGALVSAGRLIMAAEKLGLVHLLDRRALDLAAAQLKADKTIKLALNVSAETVKSEENAQDYIGALKILGENAHRVTIELTETAALKDPSLAAEFSNKVRALGCEFSIDDFGSGHTSFSNLMAIEAETVKIDGSLIRGIATSHHMQIFVRMMVDLAQTFSVKTVAEMVEDKADAALLRRLGVDYLQGYLFGMPSPTPTFSKQDI
jgi:diguanylate cyclase (GGDEF)-like protein